MDLNNTHISSGSGNSPDGSSCQPPQQSPLNNDSILPFIDQTRLQHQQYQHQPSLPPINSQFTQALYGTNTSVSTSPVSGPTNFAISNASSSISTPSTLGCDSSVINRNSNIRSGSSSATSHTDRKTDGLVLPPLNFSQQLQQQQQQQQNFSELPTQDTSETSPNGATVALLTPATNILNTSSASSATASTPIPTDTVPAPKPTQASSEPKKRRPNKRTAAVAAAAAGSPSTTHPQPVKKRRSLSCKTCRKLKTRCDFDENRGKCHRCFMLRLPCSLSIDQIQQPNYLAKINLKPTSIDVQPLGISTRSAASGSGGSHASFSNGASANEDDVILTRLECLETALGDIGKQLQSLKGLLVEKRAAAISASTNPIPAHKVSPTAETFDNLVLDKNVDQSPLCVIWNIDCKLFDRSEKYATMQAASTELNTWIDTYIDTACEQRLKDSFYNRCESYIILHSGIKAPVTSPLMRGVLLLQGMRCDEGATYDTLQPQLFNIVRSLMGTAMMTASLPISDIESLLYTAMFNFARKPHQPIFDSWLLSSHAVRLFMLSVRFHEIAARGARSQLTSDDEYTLRVWNGLCLVHYQYAVLTDRPVTIPGEYLMMCELLTSSASFDNCSLAEIKLYQAVMAAKAAGDIVPLRRWYRQFGTTLLSSSPDLRLGYDLCVIILEAPAQKIEASIRVLNLVLSLPCDRIAAMPNYPLIIIIHAVMTLCKHLSTTTDVGEHLTLIVRIYWYLAQIGEQSRDIVDSIARIIKSVIMATRKGNEIFNHVVSPNQQDLPEPKLLPPLQDSDLTLDSIDKLFFDTFDHSQCKSLDEFCNRVFNYVINKTDLIWTKD